MQSFTSVCQTQPSTLKPLLIREGDKITYYAFTREQVVDILKCYATRDLHAEKIDSLQATIITYEKQSDEYKELISNLEVTNTRLYKISEQYDTLVKNDDKIQVNYIIIKKALEQKIRDRNKTIFLLTATNIVTIVLIFSLL